MVEVVEVLIGSDPGAHGADVEAEQHAADGAEGGQNLDVNSQFRSNIEAALVYPP